MNILPRRFLLQFALISIASVGLLAAAEPPAVPITLDVNSAGPTISPLLFSFNLEHTRHAMWKGISAELLANRKFAGKSVADGLKRSKVVRGAEGPDGVVAHWYGVGKPAARFAPDTQRFYAGKQSQRIEIVAERSVGGIGQGEIPIQAGTEYAARFQLMAVPSVNATVRLCDASAKEYLHQTLRLQEGDWRPWTFNFKAPRTDLKARLEITFEGPGRLWVGSASLMPADNFHGLRRDVIARLKEISVPMLRWPGGNFTRDYRWKEGLLPVDRRPPIAARWHETLPFTDNYDFHELGIDEYLALCREIGSLPCITLTVGIARGDHEAADWVEYCNGSAETPWGKIRAERGHEQPYQVEHWTIGNEVWGDWMGPSFYTLPAYAEVVKQYAAAVRKVDPSAVLIASGVGAGWDQKLLEQAGTPFDWISRHEYCPITQAISGPAGCQEFTRQACRPRDFVLPWLKEARRALDQSGPGGKRLGIAYDEWNLWHDWFINPMANQWHVGPIDAAFAAAHLNMLCQEAGNLNIPMAAMFQPINEGAIVVKPFSAELTAMGQVFALYRAHHGGRALKTEPPQGPRAVDACASLAADGKRVRVTLINRATGEDRPVELLLVGAAPAAATATVLSVKRLEPDAVMDKRVDNITAGSDGKMRLLLPRFGIALVEIALR
jgi:alpha-N-arabinofuranosidase